MQNFIEINLVKYLQNPQHTSANVIEVVIHVISLFYNLEDIFVIMYFGNEIKLQSSRLGYCLFESDWIDQPQSTIKNLIIFGELLQQPIELVTLYIYPLTLDTFTSVCLFDDP